ncbi:hypothetical protein HA402_015400 [Bradysia odoriphaga]|nr:hypothetical protein HA402_015400 [Bradysia odoriphaga]
MSAVNVPKVLLNDGTYMPSIGLGTWGSDWGVTFGQRERGAIEQAVKDAIDLGYLHIDTALVYDTEKEVGNAINSKIQDGVVKREDLYIVSKLWNTFHRPDLVRGALLQSLKNLNTPYLDLYLVHWPLAHKEDQGLFPVDDQGNVSYSFVDFVDTWKEMEKLVDDGYVKSIGISNFSKAQTERLLSSARIKPVTNQVECHAYLTQTKLSDYLRSKGITITAFAPLGSPARPWLESVEPVLLEEPTILQLAAKYNKTPAQIALRYQIERGHIAIPKSSNKVRLAENIAIFDFSLNDDELAEMNKLNKNKRYFLNDVNASHPDYPFNDEY